MQFFKKLPLYLGLFVLVASILASVAKVGQRNAVTRTASQAAVKGAKLSLVFTSPDILSILLTSTEDVLGVDVVLEFDNSRLSILPSTLSGGSFFTTSAATVDDRQGTFSFSALARRSDISSGVVATFRIVPKDRKKTETEIKFNTLEGKTVVLGKKGKKNILKEAKGRKIRFEQS